MNPLLYNPKLKRQDSSNPLLPNLFHLNSPKNVFPNFHTSFVKKNNQLKKLAFCSFDRLDKKPNKTYYNHISNTSNLSRESKQTKINELDNNNDIDSKKIINFYDKNKRFQQSVWSQSNTQWNTIGKKPKYTFHEKNDNPYQRTTPCIGSSQKSAEDQELILPAYMTKNTIENEKNIQKRIDFLKEEIKKKDFKFRKFNPKYQVKKERVFLRGVGESAKEVHYLVYDFEDETEQVLIRKSRGRSLGNDNKNIDEYGNFQKRHRKNITVFEKTPVLYKNPKN